MKQRLFDVELATLETSVIRAETAGQSTTMIFCFIEKSIAVQINGGKERAGDFTGADRRGGDCQSRARQVGASWHVAYLVIRRGMLLSKPGGARMK